MKIRNELDQEIRERRGDVQAQERRLIQKEENLEKKLSNVEEKEVALDKKEQEIEVERQEVQRLKDSELDNLEKIARMSVDEAKTQLLKKVDESLSLEKAERIKEHLLSLSQSIEASKEEIKTLEDKISQEQYTFLYPPLDNSKSILLRRTLRFA